MSNGPAVQQPVLSWWNLSYWIPRNDVKSASAQEKEQLSPALERGAAVTADVQVPASSSQTVVSPESQQASTASDLSGWDRIRALYEQPSMEADCCQRIARMTFLTGFLFGGASTYAQAHETFERSNVGRKYLSPSDAFKRRMDYAIVRFAKSGFSMGMKAALISGSIVILSTHVAAYRQRFSSWYLPAFSGALAVALHEVGGVFTFPLGVIGSVKAVGLGVTSGLTLAAVVHLYALSMDKSVDQAYWTFKREYESDMRSTREWEERVTELMKAEGYKWRGSAAQRLRKLDEEKIAAQDT